MQANEVRFGVEIECYMPRDKQSQYPVGRHHQPVQVPCLPAGWKSKTDASLQRPPTPYHFPIEIVSPVLQGEDGLVQVVAVVNRLLTDGAQVNTSCGLHVHVDATHLSPEQVQAIKAQFKRYEKAFYAVSGEYAGTRYNNHFCANSLHWSADGNRYQSLNVSNYGRRDKNTLEVRVWASTLVDTEVVAAISMAVALVSRTVTEQPTCTRRIEEPRTALRQFCRDHFRTAAHRIVPDAPIADIVLRAYHQAKRAAPALAS